MFARCRVSSCLGGKLRVPGSGWCGTCTAGSRSGCPLVSSGWSAARRPAHPGVCVLLARRSVSQAPAGQAAQLMHWEDGRQWRRWERSKVNSGVESRSGSTGAVAVVGFFGNRSETRRSPPNAQRKARRQYRFPEPRGRRKCRRLSSRRLLRPPRLSQQSNPQRTAGGDGGPCLILHSGPYPHRRFRDEMEVGN